MKWIIAATALFLLPPVNAAMASGELDRFLTCTDQGLAGKTERKVAAGEIVSVLRNMSHAIPAVSEDEKVWLKAEIDDTLAASGGKPTIRAVEAEKSAAYAKQKEKILTERIVKTAQDIHIEELDPVKEMESWIAIQNDIFLSGYIGYIATLIDAGLLASADVPLIASAKRQDEHFQAFTYCLVNTIVNELP